jgi:arylsulfatase
MVVIEDTGFAHFGCYGGLGGRIKTPTLDQLAQDGIRYNNFHATPLCSPSRACFLSGRNHHSVGVGVVMEISTGYPGYNGEMPHEAALLPEVLVEHGYNTMALGKWHLIPESQMSISGPYDRWPMARGFERYYGFLPGETDQWEPDLWLGNERVDPPATPEQGYHVSKDLVEHAITWIGEQKAVTPDKPFYMYLAFGALHAPHQAPQSYIDAYKGAFDAGWDVIREETLARQKELGIVPPNTDLPPRNPGVSAWGELSDAQKTLFRKQMEAAAGFLTYTDEQVGRLIAFLRASGLRDDTLVIVAVDHGASGEGGPLGMSAELTFFNGMAESVEDMLKVIDRWGQPGTTPLYCTGWAMAGNTPFRWYKQQTHEGGVHVPLIVSWPARVKGAGGIRHQFHHAVDLYPTILQLIGLEMPSVVKGYSQMPLPGVSMLYDAPDAPTRKKVQYFEMLGHRGIWHDGWKAVTFHLTKDVAKSYGFQPPAQDATFEEEAWELYHLDEDFSEAHDLAQQQPEKLKELIERWWAEAGKYGVLPLDGTVVQRMLTPKPSALTPRTTYTFTSPVRLVRSASPDVKRRSHTITAQVEIPVGGTVGVIVCDGGPDGGYTLCIKDDRATYVSSFLGRAFTVVTSDAPLPSGPVTLRVVFTKTGPISGHVALYQNDQQVGEADVPATNPIMYAETDGLQIGSNSGSPVWPGYQSPFTFTGTIKRVEIAIGSDQVTTPETHAAVAAHTIATA